MTQEQRQETPPAAAQFSFCASDGSGATAESMLQALAPRFGGLPSKLVERPFCSDPDLAASAGRDCARMASELEQGQFALCATTLADPASRIAFASEIEAERKKILWVDLFEAARPRAEAVGAVLAPGTGGSHGRSASDRERRAEALDYALAFDDGARTDLSGAEIIVLGPSRCGKTPTCIWLALRRGIFAANWPLLPEDFGRGLSPSLTGKTHLCVCLLTSPERLSEVRQKRKAGSVYASLAQCAEEIENSRAFCRKYAIPVIDTCGKSVEEISAEILLAKGVKNTNIY